MTSAERMDKRIEITARLAAGMIAGGVYSSKSLERCMDVADTIIGLAEMRKTQEDSED